MPTACRSSRSTEREASQAQAARPQPAHPARQRALHPLQPLRALHARDLEVEHARHRRARRARVRRAPRSEVRRRPVLGQRHRPVPDGRPPVARLPLPEPRVVSRAGAFGVHGLLARLQHRSVAAQEGVAAALARRGAQQHAVPRHRPREPRDQRSVALQQGLRPAQADEQGADADAHAWRRAGIDRTGARPGPRPDRASAQSGRPRLGASPPTRSSTSSRRRSARASASTRARTASRSPGRWSRTTS